MYNTDIIFWDGQEQTVNESSKQQMDNNFIFIVISAINNEYIIN